MTGQPIPIVMRILFFIKTNHPDQSNPKYYAQRRWFFSKTSWKKPILLLKCLVRPWSGRPVLTFGKRPKIMTLYILEVHLNFLWWCASKTKKTKVSKLRSIRVSHIFGAWNSVWDDLSSRLGYVFKYYHDDDDDYYSPPKGHLSTKAFFFLAGWGWGGGGDGQSPRSLLFNGHFLLSQSGRCKVVQLYQYNLLYDTWKALMQTNIYFQIKLAADKCYNEYSQRTHRCFRSSLLSTRPKLSNACESEPPNSFCYFSGWEKRRPDIRLRSLRTTNKAQCQEPSCITFATFTLCILCASFLDLQWRFVIEIYNVEICSQT